MYFPYLRGRQFELIALRELADKGLISDKVMPIIEPIKFTPTLVKTTQKFDEVEMNFALVMNPDVSSSSGLLDELPNLRSDLSVDAYIIKDGSNHILEGKDHLDDFMIINPKRDCMRDYLKIYENNVPRLSLIPDDSTFKRRAKGEKILFVNRFDKAQRNSDYLEREDEFFSADHLYYKDDGFDGFADYSIVGSDDTRSGFAPRVVAIHIVYFDDDKELRIKHFVSDSNDDIKDPAGKFGEALGKLVDWVEHEDIENRIEYTEGVKSFLRCYDSGKYPGLGTVKKYSIMHHLELMSTYLDLHN